MKPSVIIIRGPLGCGKSTISKTLAKEINAEYFEVDEPINKGLVEKTKEEGYISQKTFFAVNDLIAQEAKPLLKSGKNIIIDGNFYWKSTIENLAKKLPYPQYVFTLTASLETCIERDSKRQPPHGKIAAEVVYKKTISFDYGDVINIEEISVEEAVNEIKEKLKWNLQIKI